MEINKGKLMISLDFLRICTENAITKYSKALKLRMQEKDKTVQFFRKIHESQ